MFRLLFSGLLLLGLLACEEDPIDIEGRIWCLESESGELLQLVADSPECNSRGYLNRNLGGLTVDSGESFWSVDLSVRQLVNLDPGSRIGTEVVDLGLWIDPRDLVCDAQDRIYMLDSGQELVQLDPERPTLQLVRRIRPDGDWRLLGAMPDAGVSSNGDLLPMGTLLIWRPLGAGGELCWLDLLEDEAWAYPLRSTSDLTALATSFLEHRLYGFQGRELIHLDPLESTLDHSLQVYDCEDFQIAGLAVP